MQEGGQKVEATGSTRFQNTLWSKINLDRTSLYIDGLIDSVLLEAQPYLNFMTQTPKSKPLFITLPKYTVLIIRG